MAAIRGIFKVVSREHYHNGQHVLVKLESTQVTTEMFAARIEIMLIDPATIDRFTNGAELVVEVLASSKKG